VHRPGLEGVQCFTQWGYGPTGEELNDRKNDPGEFAKLAREPKYADQLAQLKARLEARRVEAGYDPKWY